MKKLLIIASLFLSAELKAQSPVLGQEIGIKIDTISSSLVEISSKAAAFKNLAELRGTKASLLDTGTLYILNTGKVVLKYKWNGTSTAADDSVTVVQRTGTSTGRFELYYETYIQAEWFGAVPDDGNDDTHAFQKAVDFIQRTGKRVKLTAGSGTFEINNLVLYKDVDANGRYEFHTIEIEGAFPAFVSPTIFKSTVNHGFCIGIQFGRLVTIKNISFEGPVKSGPHTIKNTIEWSTATWLDTIVNNQFSPGGTAIVIDPFHPVVDSANRYAGLSSWYGDSARSGTSMVTIDGCAFRYYNVAIMNGPTGAGGCQNGDNIKVTNSKFEDCRIVWAAGQTQSRANTMENCYLLGPIQYMINCIEYGETRGTPPNTYNMNISGGMKYLHYITGGFSGISHYSLKAEGLWSIGRSDVMPVNFVNSHIALLRPDENGTHAAPLLAQGTNISFKGGVLEWFDNIHAGGLPFDAENLSFDGVYLNGLPVNSNYHLQKTTYQNSYLAHAGGLLGTLNTAGNFVAGAEITQVNRTPFVSGMSFSSSGPINYTATGPKIDVNHIEDRQIVSYGTTDSGYFLSTTPSAYQVNDMLWGQNVNWASDDYSTAFTSMGWVYRKSGDTIKIKYMPYGLDPATSYPINITRVPKFIARTTGDIISGSNVVNDLTYYQATFAVGDYIKGAGIPVGARVTAKSGSTLTLSMNATATTQDIQLFDAEYKQEGFTTDPAFISYLNPGWEVGDHISNTNIAANNITQWTVSERGFTGLTGHEPTFLPNKSLPLDYIELDNLNTIVGKYAGLGNSGGVPYFYMRNPSAPTDSKTYEQYVTSDGTFRRRLRDDAFSVGAEFEKITRTGLTANKITWTATDFEFATGGTVQLTNTTAAAGPVLHFNNSAKQYGIMVPNAAYGGSYVNKLILVNETDGGYLSFDGTKLGINKNNPATTLDLTNNTDAIGFPKGTTAQRPSTAAALTRWNTDTTALEVDNGTNYETIASRPWVRSLFAPLSAAGAGAGNLTVINDADYTIAASVTHVVFRTLTAARTVTLPAASANTNRVLTIKNGGDGAFALNLSTSIKENTSSSISSIAQNAWVTIVSDGTDWWIVAN